MFSKYQLPNFLEFLSKYKTTDDRAKHTLELVWSYYHFAYYQMISLNETSNLFFKEAPEGNEIITTYLHKSWSYAYGMYTLLRTTLESLSIFRKMISDIKPVDSYYQKEVERVIFIANDIVKHPMFKHNIVSTGTQPIALSLNGLIDVAITSPNGHTLKTEIDPIKDFEVIHNYIEYVFSNLKENL